MRAARYVFLLLTLVALVGGVAGPAAATVPLPDRLRHLGSSRQVVIVQDPTPSGDHGTVEAWQRDAAGGWRRVLAPQAATLGRYGVVPGGRRVEGDLRTPEGTFGLSFAFGLDPNPGSRLPYARLTGSDYWVGDHRDPATYNLFEPFHPADDRWSTAHAEHLAAVGPVYRYAVNIDFNVPTGLYRAADGQRAARHPADLRLGYAIFLHSFGRTGPSGFTVGCVGIDPATLARLLRWLDPRQQPRIVIGTSADIAAW